MKEREIMAYVIAVIPRNLDGEGTVIYMERPMIGMEINEEAIKAPYREIYGWCKRCKSFQDFIEDDFNINNKHRLGIKYECMRCGRKYRRKQILKETIRHLEDAKDKIKF